MAHHLLVALLTASLLLPLAYPDSTLSPRGHHRVRQALPPGLPRVACSRPTRGPTRSTPALGTFAIDLRSSYHILLPAGSYLTAFSDRLKGYLDDRCISGLDGIRVRAFFRWWSITGTDDLLSLCGIELRADVELHNDELHSSK